MSVHGARTARRGTATLAVTLAAALAAAALGGCGQKGPLYLPNRHQAKVPPAAASAAASPSTTRSAAHRPAPPP